MFLAIAVDNLGDAEEMDEIQKEKEVAILYFTHFIYILLYILKKSYMYCLIHFGNIFYAHLNRLMSCYSIKSSAHRRQYS